MELLRLLHGVDWPTASTILHFCDRRAYPILDYRALWSLGYARPPHYTMPFWLGYVGYVRDLVRRSGQPMRTVDRALWQYSRERVSVRSSIERKTISRSLPGIGPSLARDLRALGVRRVGRPEGARPRAAVRQAQSSSRRAAGPVRALRLPLRRLLGAHPPAAARAAQVVELEGPRAPPVTAKAKADLPVKRFSSPAKWEAWLEKQHAMSEGIWLEFGKKGSGVPSVTYAEALETALRYGWIDGQTASVDAKFTASASRPAVPESKWSKIETAPPSSGSWPKGGWSLRDCARWRRPRRTAAGPAPTTRRATSSVPDDLAAELRERPAARRFFEQLDSQNRYAVLYRLFDAKKPETRQRRLEQFVRMLEAGEQRPFD